MKAWLVALALGLSGGAWAQPTPGERPPVVPGRDALVAYHLSPATGEAIDVLVSFRAGGSALRLDLPDASWIVASPPTKGVLLMVPQDLTATELPWAEGPQPLFILDERGRFTKRAEATLAGQRCTVWESVNDPSKRTLCITKEGVILRHQFQDGQGRRNLVEAFAVRFEAVPDAAFAVPAGYDRLSAMQAAPQGLSR